VPPPFAPRPRSEPHALPLFSQVAYCAGWSASTASIVGPISPATARERDSRGEPYAVVLGDAAGTPLVLLEISWRDAHCGVWTLDGRRRTAHHRFVRDGDRLLLIRSREWRYAEEDPEFHDGAWYREREYEVDGSHTQLLRPHGERGSFRQDRDRNPDSTVHRRTPAFGDWADLAMLHPAVVSPPALTEAAAEDAPVEAPWSPPRPLRFEHADALFRPGAVFRSGHWTGRTARVEVHDAGVLRLPTGRVVACDPTSVWERTEPYTVPVPVGDHPVALSAVRFDDDPTHVRAAAARVVFADVPVASWEPATLPGQDPRRLDDGEFFGFGVDGGIGCFFDAAALPHFLKLMEDFDRYTDVFLGDNPEGIEVQGERTLSITDPDSGANLVAFSSGWGDGSYPVWAGRDADGRVCRLVADLLVVNGATLLG